LAFIIQRHETLSRDGDASTTMKKKTTPASRSKPPAAPAGVEEAVRLSEIRYRRLFETTHDGVLLLDPVTRQITDANPFMTRLLDYPHDQLVGKELFEIGLLEDEAASQVMFRKLKRQHEVRYEDLPLESRTGRHQEVEVVANLYQENGHAVIQCNIRDITARRQTEETLNRSEALFSTLIEQAPYGIYIVDAKFRLQQVNDRALPIFKNIQPLIGRDFSEIHHLLWSKRVSDPIIKRFRHTLKTGEPYHAPEFNERRRDIGTRQIYDWQIQRVTLPSGEHAVVAFFKDITARKKAEGVQRRLDVLTASNQKLEAEIVHRQAVEAALRQSERQQGEMLAQSRAMQEQLRQLSRQVLQAQEDERKRISRELHDVIAQTLTGINIRLGTLKQAAGLNVKDFGRNIARTQRLVEKSVGIVHRFARELRPAVLDDLGLIPALHAYLKGFMADTGIRVSLKVFAGVEQVDAALRTVLYRVAQEALTNVSRHAHASRVMVSIEQQPQCLSMKITDDGQAFDVEHALQSGKRLGLLGMRERLEMVGGSFGITSVNGQGTTIEARLPLRKVRVKQPKRPAKPRS
jgi:PAS domain S-box-containing protein